MPWFCLMLVRTFAMLPRVAGGFIYPAKLCYLDSNRLYDWLGVRFPHRQLAIPTNRRVSSFRLGFYFAVASLICAYCSSLYGFLAARIVLGISGGITLPIAQSMILKEYPDRNKAIGVGI